MTRAEVTMGGKGSKGRTLLLVALALSCTIDARTIEGGGGDGGSAAVTVGEFSVVYLAPVNAAANMCSNFSDSWSCGTAVSGRTTVRWTGDLELRRLDLPACTAHAIGNDCGYVANVSFGAPPYWAVTQASGGGFSAVGEWNVTGPVPVEFVPVENGIKGANNHLRRVRR